MDDLKEKMKKIDRKFYIIGAVALVVIGGFFVWKSNKKENVVDDVQVSFSGYNGKGSANFNTKAAYDKITNAIAKKEGLKDVDIARIKSASNISYESMPDIYAKASKTEQLISMVKISLSKYTNLKNGEKVTLKVDVPSKDIPIKPVEKEITVKGLKKVKTLTMSDIKKDLDIKFNGIDGIGTAVINSKKYKDLTLKVKHNGKLKNNDEAKVSISRGEVDSMTSEGTVFSGKKDFTVKVAGLKEAKSIANLQNVLNLNNEFANSKNKSSENIKHKVELLHSYIEPTGDDLSSEITVNKDSDEPIRYNVIGLYKVTTQYNDDDPEVHYNYYGYEDLTLEDGKFNIEDKNVDDDGIYEINFADSLSLATQKMGSKAMLVK